MKNVWEFGGWIWRKLSSSFVTLVLVLGVQHFIPKLIKTLAFSLLISAFALGGAAIGAITGTIKGQTTETGVLRGFGVGAVSGAIMAIHLMDSMLLNAHRFSKVALMVSLVNGKIFMEWVSPAVLIAYQWQMSNVEIQITDIFEDVNGTTSTILGMSNDTINKLPQSDFQSMMQQDFHHCTCAICLQELKKRDSIRKLPKCKHLFHIHCIDQWLSRQGNCPICRAHV